MSAYGQWVTKSNVQNVHRQPAHKLTNHDATDESLLWRLRELPTCVLGPLRWSMPKITKSDAKLFEIYEQNECNLFPGNVIYDFWTQKFYKVL